ncbi:hypothetical protein HNR26_002158 [Rhizobium rosettiformans]|uniref:DUF4160 domain-containing protein n=2 Tax=Rhizobium rosettiformans TaxID=1368430 RepID=A0A4S8PYN0_9HYPH|nr:DUF4160 domain-containing protein [Rhizobium rosettiformans]MBB5276106.1 hypothetical protein [Rhizobium rosettiformans]THV36750.1 DUF4160 domain-containing protein [Rhizobium rosettiformans W3]
MPTVLRKYGFRFHFYGFDMGEPRHIHVSGHGGTAKIWLEPIELVEAKGFNTADLRRIMDVVEDHHGQFVEAWNEFAKSVS